jgi:hypothetical protein
MVQVFVSLAAAAPGDVGVFVAFVRRLGAVVLGRDEVHLT